MSDNSTPSRVDADPFNYFESVLKEAERIGGAQHAAMIKAYGDEPARRRDMLDLTMAQSEVILSLGSALTALLSEEDGSRERAITYLSEALKGQIRFAQSFQLRVALGDRFASFVNGTAGGSDA